MPWDKAERLATGEYQTPRAVIGAALAGTGIARMLSNQVARDIAEGRLVEILTPCQTAALPVHLVHGGQPMVPIKLRAFGDCAASRLKNQLPQTA